MKLEVYTECVNTVKDLLDSLKLNGVKGSAGVDFDVYDAWHIRVTVDGEYYGIWDIDRKTFVD